MNILITSAGQRVSLVRAFQQELKKFKLGGRVFTVDLNPELSPACRISDGYKRVKNVKDAQYIPELIEYCGVNEIGMVVPTIDTELLTLADNKKVFEDHGIRVIISSAEFIAKCRDKRKINAFFKKNDMDIPASVDKNNPAFPLFIKPYDGSGSADTFVIGKAEELTAYHYANEKLLFMEYIDKEKYDEFTVDMYYGRDNKVKCIVPRKRITVRAGEISKGLTSRNIIVPFLLERLGHIQDAVGCVTLQLFLHKESGRIVASEINPRFGGGYPLSYLAGANYPEWLIREYFLNEAILYFDGWENDLLMLRYDDEILVHGYKAEA